MANNPRAKDNLRPFTSTNQPANRGRKGKSVTEHLKDIGNSKKIQFQITITKNDGTVVEKKGDVKSKVEMNQLLATLLYSDALQGNDKARKEVLDRLEGKPQQHIELGGGLGMDVRDNKLDLSKLSDAALAEIEKAYSQEEE